MNPFTLFNRVYQIIITHWSDPVFRTNFKERESERVTGDDLHPFTVPEPVLDPAGW